MSEIITKAATESKPQTEENRGFNRIKYHPKNTAKTKDGKPILELRPPIPKAYVAFMKSNDGAIFLSQCFYWQAKAKRPDGYFYKSVREWCEELCLTEYQVEKFRNFLHGKEILELKKLRAEGHPTWHYRINQKMFNQVFQDFLDNDFVFPNERNEKINDYEVLESEILETADAAESEIVDGEIIESENVVTMQWEIDERQPLQWLVEEIKKREMSEAEKKNERIAFANLVGCIESGFYTETDLLNRAERLRNRGVSVTAMNILQRRI